MSSATRPVLGLGLSPCPNDTFIFHALLHGLVPCEADFRPHLADVEQLNAMALRRGLEVTKFSLGAFARMMDDYAILASGAALGWGCGPLLVARKDGVPNDFATATVAIPGRMTTANLLLTLHGGFDGPRREMLFSDVMPAVARGEADLGVIIHEGRFTYAEQGLVKVLDLGEWWEATCKVPLPLGAIAVRRDVPLALARQVEQAIAASLRHARAHPQDSAAFVRGHAQEMDPAVTRAHIDTFVTDFSIDLGQPGRDAISLLVGRAAAMLGRSLPEDGIFLSSAQGAA